MKKLLIVVFAILSAFSLLGLSASPTAIQVGRNKVDASEYAYYLRYNRLNQDDTSVMSEEETLKKAREGALNQIVTAEVVRIKCQEIGLKISSDQKKALKEEKKELIESSGGYAGYRDFLRENYLTDRLYDKIQKDACYYSMLFQAVTEGDRALNDQELRQFYNQSYIRVSQIFFPIVDDSGAALPPGEQALQQDLAQTVLDEIISGKLTFYEAMSQYNGESALPDMVFGPGDIQESPGSLLDPIVSDSFKLKEGVPSGVYNYPNGYYLLFRQPPEIEYFEKNRERVEVASKEVLFQTYIDQAGQRLPVREKKICQRINFDNLKDYIK